MKIEDYSHLSLEELQALIDEKIQAVDTKTLIRVRVAWDVYLYMPPEEAILLFKIIKNSVSVKTSYNTPSVVGRFSNTNGNDEVFGMNFSNNEELTRHQISQLLQIPPQEIALAGGKLIEVPRDEINI